MGIRIGVRKRTGRRQDQMSRGNGEILYIRRWQYGEENFVYLLSYVLAPRSSDVSSQFRRLQSDRRGGRSWNEARTREEAGSGYAEEPISTSIFAKHYRYDDAARVQQPVHVRAPGVPRRVREPPPAFRNTFLLLLARDATTRIANSRIIESWAAAGNPLDKICIPLGARCVSTVSIAALLW